MLTDKQKNTRKFLEDLVIFFAIGATSIGVIRQAKNINRTYKENTELRRYAALAHDVAVNIKPDTVDNFDYCTDTNCMTCKAVRNGNKMALNDYNKAIDTLKIDRQKLNALRQNPIR